MGSEFHEFQHESSGLTPKQLLPSELLGRVIGGLLWHEVGVEPPKRVSNELNDVRVAVTMSAELHSSGCCGL